MAASESAAVNVPTDIVTDLLHALKNNELTYEQVQQQIVTYQTSQSKKLAGDQTVSNQSKSMSRSRGVVARAKSVPVNNGTSDDTHRRSSMPEVFKFPDLSKMNSRQIVMKDSNGSQNIEKTDKKMLKQSITTSLSLESVDEGCEAIADTSRDKQVLQNNRASKELSDPVDEGFVSGTSGVSPIYFNNVINELVKTKQCLHNLQKQQLHYKEEKSAVEEMRKELEKIQVQNQHLKGQLSRLNLVQERLNQREESVEIKMETSHVAIQTDPYPEEYRELQQHVNVLNCDLRRDNENLKQELHTLNGHYNTLKNSVKVLSTCLQEEKRRVKQNEENNRKLNMEKQQLVEKLGTLRQKHELVQQEKLGLEKSLALCNSPDPAFQPPAPHSQIPSHTCHSGNSPLESHGWGGSPYATVKGINAASPGSSLRSMTSDRTRSFHASQQPEIPFALNNLSPSEGRERAPSNIPHVSMPVCNYGPDRTNSAPSRYNAMGSTVSTRQYEQMVRAESGHGRVSSEPTNRAPTDCVPMLDSQAHDNFECPRCQQDFQVENSYLLHLQKCIE